MASQFGEITVEGITSAKAATSPTELVRKNEFDQALGSKASIVQLTEAIEGTAHPAVTVAESNQSISIEIDDDQVMVAEVRLTNSYPLAPEESFLEIGEKGLKVKTGATSDTVAPGDHTHPVTGYSGNNGTDITVSISGTNVVSATINLAPNSGLSKANGLGVDWAAVAAKGHTHGEVTDAQAGFMTPAHKAILDSLGSLVAYTGSETESIVVQIVDGQVRATMVPGIGWIIDNNGLRADWDVIAAKADLDALTARVAALESA